MLGYFVSPSIAGPPANVDPIPPNEYLSMSNKLNYHIFMFELFHLLKELGQFKVPKSIAFLLDSS